MAEEHRASLEVVAEEADELRNQENVAKSGNPLGHCPSITFHCAIGTMDALAGGAKSGP